MGAYHSCGKTCSNCSADCARTAQGFGDENDDERAGGDPAGATFEETLEDLNTFDRHLLLFCAGSNAAAVRWLLHLGAHWDACDANGTTGLHVACRAGALSVVTDMLHHKGLLQAADVAGWSPLHIAVTMGRKEVVIRLLQAGASPKVRNAKGQLPAELVVDGGTFEAIRSFERHQQVSPGKPWQFSKEKLPTEDNIGSRLQYEPFFVPRQPVIRSQQYKKEFQRIGMLMFNQQPGFGLAFLVAAGVARDYPVDMSTFLRRTKVDIKQVGSFLGEAFSLSHTIRLEFINSVALQNTGIVAALVQVFHLLQLPDDLQKINRLIHGVARIWWRQHERLQKEYGSASAAVRRAQGGPQQKRFSEETGGLELKQCLNSSDSLHQLMFSTVMLHWFIYKDGMKPLRELPFDVWKRFNAGLGIDGAELLDEVQRQIHALVSKAFVPELAVASSTNGDGTMNPITAAVGVRSCEVASGGGPDAGGGHGPADELGSVARERPNTNLLGAFAGAEGWAQIVGGGFPRPSGLTGSQTVSYQHMSSIFSESTQNTSGLPKNPLAAAGDANMQSGRRGGPTWPEVSALGKSKENNVWLSLCYTLLFFSSSPQIGAPYAFVELRRVCVASLDEQSRIATLVGVPDTEEADADLVAAGGAASPPLAAAGASSPTARGDAEQPLGPPPTPVVIVLLLPDGRWQEVNLPKLELRVDADADLQMWSSHLSAASQGKIARPTAQSKASGQQPLSPRSTPTKGPPCEPSARLAEPGGPPIAPPAPPVAPSNLPELPTMQHHERPTPIDAP